MRVVLQCLLVFLAGAECCFAESFLGERREFLDLRNGNLTVSPSGDRLAIVSTYECALFVANPEGDEWLGPFKAPFGGFGGTREVPDLDVRSRRTRVFYSWSVTSDGNEVLVLNPISNRAVFVDETGAKETTAAFKTDSEIVERSTGRLRKGALDAPENIRDRKLAMYREIKGRDATAPGFVSEREDANLPETLFGIADFSPQHDRVLCRPEEDDPLLSLNLVTGEQIPFYVQNNRDRALPGDMSGSFSPDGEYVLMQYSYGPDDHFSGGYLQLFTKDGEFVEEVAEFHKDVAMPVGFHEWLHNNWIVYSTGKEIVFKKFVGPAAESER